MRITYAACPWQRLYFRPEPHGQGSLRPMACAPLPDGADCVELDEPPLPAGVNVDVDEPPPA